MRWSIITYGCYTYESTYFWLFMCCITCDASGRVNKSYINANVKGSISAADRKRNHQGFFYSSIINEGWRLIYRLITRLHREWCRDTMMEGVNKKERVESLVSYRNHRETSSACSGKKIFPSLLGMRNRNWSPMWGSPLVAKPPSVKYTIYSCLVCSLGTKNKMSAAYSSANEYGVGQPTNRLIWFGQFVAVFLVTKSRYFQGDVGSFQPCFWHQNFS